MTTNQPLWDKIDSESVSRELPRTRQIKYGIGEWLISEGCSLYDFQYEWETPIGRRVDVALLDGDEPTTIWEIGFLVDGDRNIKDHLKVCRSVIWIPAQALDHVGYMTHKFLLSYHSLYNPSVFEEQCFIVLGFKEGFGMKEPYYIATSNKTLAEVFGLINDLNQTISIDDLFDHTCSDMLNKMILLHLEILKKVQWCDEDFLAIKQLEQELLKHGFKNKLLLNIEIARLKKRNVKTT